MIFINRITDFEETQFDDIDYANFQTPFQKWNWFLELKPQFQLEISISLMSFIECLMSFILYVVLHAKLLPK